MFDRPDIFVSDDFHIRSEDGVAIGVIVMKMRVDHPSDRLVRDAFHILEQRPCGSGRGPVINQHHVTIVDDYGMVSSGRHRTAGSGIVNSIRDFLELINLTRDRCRG
jgi:hypothetical protein